MDKEAIGRHVIKLTPVDMSNMSEIETNRKRKKTGGRPPGGVNKKTAEVQKMVAESGITPLEYLLTVMRDAGGEPRERINAAIAAAPYVHAKLSTVDLKAEVSGTLKHEHSQRPKLTRSEWLASLAK